MLNALYKKNNTITCGLRKADVGTISIAPLPPVSTKDNNKIVTKEKSENIPKIENKSSQRNNSTNSKINTGNNKSHKIPKNINKKHGK